MPFNVVNSIAAPYLMSSSMMRARTGTAGIEVQDGAADDMVAPQQGRLRLGAQQAVGVGNDADANHVSWPDMRRNGPMQASSDSVMHIRNSEPDGWK